MSDDDIILLAPAMPLNAACNRSYNSILVDIIIGTQMVLGTGGISRMIEYDNR